MKRDAYMPPIRVTTALLEAIDDCCRFRGDSEDNRLALRVECAALPSEQQLDLLQHFTCEAAIWAHATGHSGQAFGAASGTHSKQAQRA